MSLSPIASRPLRLLLVAGARPNFMKIAPLIKALEVHNRQNSDGSPRVDWRLLHTGQHYDAQMSDVFFRELGIPAPDIGLDVGSGSHAAQTATIMTRFEPVCESEKPDWVIVVGDVNSTLACTLVAAKLGIKVAHVEAGLRSYDRTMPEEINRLVTDALADLLLTPSEDANVNLRREGVAEEKIRLVGNIMIDSLVSNLAAARSSAILSDLAVHSQQYVYVTLHRPSNVDNEAALKRIVDALHRIDKSLPLVFPVHPRTKERLARLDNSFAGNGWRMIDPVGYHASLKLTEEARFVLTDSGGLQEETTFFRTPCLTLRPNTERPITVTLGSNRLTTVEQLDGDINEVLAGESRIGAIPPLWDGRTAARIIDSLVTARE